MPITYGAVVYACHAFCGWFLDHGELPCSVLCYWPRKYCDGLWGGNNQTSLSPFSLDVLCVETGIRNMGLKEDMNSVEVR